MKLLGNWKIDEIWNWADSLPDQGLLSCLSNRIEIQVGPIELLDHLIGLLVIAGVQGERFQCWNRSDGTELLLGDI